jgi:hypothetical protein
MTTVIYPIAPSRSTILTGRRLILARLAWGMIACLCLLLLLLIAPRSPRLLFFEPLVEDSYALVAELMTYRAYLNYIVLVRYMVMGIFYLTGVFIFWRKSDDWLVMLTSIALICLPYMFLFAGILYSAYDQFNQDLWLKAGDASLTALGILSVPTLLIFFPDGRLEPQRLQKLVRGLFTLLFLLVFIPLVDDFVWKGINWAEIIFYILSGDFLALILIGSIGQFYRFLWVSTPMQRQQTKWIVFAILINLAWAIFITVRADTLRFTAAAIYGLFELHASMLVVALIPISFAISILRYRLYDIDLIVRRTLVYGSISLVLGLFYLASITLLQSLFATLSKQQSQISIVLSTLVIVALFNPLRSRVQDFIDRRFYRSKYNAEQALAKFADTARDEVDVEQLSAHLVQTIQETINPQGVSLWLRKAGTRNLMLEERDQRKVK